MRRFFGYLKDRHPEIQSCQSIDRELLEDYLTYLKTEETTTKNLHSEITRFRALLESISKMMDEGEKVTIPKLMEKTGLSRGFFYKNPIVRKEINQALEQQAGMPDPRRNILNMAMDSEIELLRKQKEALTVEVELLKKENELLKKSLAKKNIGLLKKL